MQKLPSVSRCNVFEVSLCDIHEWVCIYDAEQEFPASSVVLHCPLFEAFSLLTGEHIRQTRGGTYLRVRFLEPYDVIHRRITKGLIFQEAPGEPVGDRVP
jgi:hypothetical protein